MNYEKGKYNMDFLSFIFSLLCLISIDCILGILIYLLWKYLDIKYFSKFEVTLLQNEIEYLKKQNQKLHNTSTDFWSDKNDNMY